MTAPTNAPVLAWVVPTKLLAASDHDGDMVADANIDHIDADKFARDLDHLYPVGAPHTVQQLARVVRVVDTETVLHVPCSREIVTELAVESAPVTVRIDTEADGIAQIVFTRYTPRVVAVDDSAVAEIVAVLANDAALSSESHARHVTLARMVLNALTPPEPTGTEGITPTPGASPEETDRE